MAPIFNKELNSYLFKYLICFKSPPGGAVLDPRLVQGHYRSNASQLPNNAYQQGATEIAMLCHSRITIAGDHNARMETVEDYIK